ncbi:muconolactone Delta-isomerase [Microbacterium sp. MPKO10]|uniref:muconolactone Delta-isomerase n=1 Tax=Microbacterium sp. MPKO10 TaxID=2989818 RepID=UPI002235A548|nr:muconolactone Delta-isomerase family protein [Microbacterium sp. MPKO10]MCW4459862.1 muconolactone delta-isomerase [Microbacterium sp. MPKO10]
MLFHAKIEVNLPTDLEPEKQKQLVTAERERALELQRSGSWVHLWRIAGERGNISIFDVASADELNDLLWSLPLFPYMSIVVTALAQHPSALTPSTAPASTLGQNQ